MTLEFSAEQVIEDLYDGLLFVDRDQRVTYWNKAAEKITGHRAADVLDQGYNTGILAHMDAAGKILGDDTCPLTATIMDGRARETEVYLHHKKGHRIPLLVRATPLRDDTGDIIGGVELFTDISSREALRLRIQELERLALLDPLTQLSNRRYLTTEIAYRCEEIRRYGTSFGLIMVDIDHFKAINDHYGHEVGDRVLCKVAETFMESVRPFDIIGRWGGEEFVGIFRNVDRPGLQLIADRLRLLVAQSKVPWQGEDLSVTVSIGGTLARPDDVADTIVRRADTLMYASKHNGRNRVTIGPERQRQWRQGADRG